MLDENKKLTESEEIDMILYGKVIDRSDWVYTTESEEYERLSEEEDLMQIFVVDQNREPLYNQSMEDMLKLADVSCEELYWVEYVDVEADVDADND